MGLELWVGRVIGLENGCVYMVLWLRLRMKGIQDIQDIGFLWFIHLSVPCKRSKINPILFDNTSYYTIIFQVCAWINQVLNTQVEKNTPGHTPP